MRLPFFSGVLAVTVVLAACHGDATATSASTPSSSPSVPQAESASPASTASPAAERVHFAGLPPKGADTSGPAIGTLVLSLSYSPLPRSSWNVYADGRMIFWHRWNDPVEAAAAPEGTSRVETGYVEQRLTPLGVQLLRSRSLSTGLFRHSLKLDARRHHAPILVGVRNGDRWVTVEAVSHPYRSWGKHFTKETPAQARALARLQTLLTDPSRWLPSTAWADRKIRTFVPSRYWVAFDRGAPVMSELPPPARALLLRLKHLFLHGCQVVTTSEARALLQALVDGGISPLDNQANGIGFGLAGPAYLHLHPALPDVTACALVH